MDGPKSRDRVTGPADRDDDVMRAVVVEQLAAEVQNKLVDPAILGLERRNPEEHRRRRRSTDGYPVHRGIDTMSLGSWRTYR